MVLISKMKDILLLYARKEEKVLIINVLNNKIVKKLRDANDTSKVQ